MGEKMKAFVMKKIGEVGWITKDRPKCGPTDAIIKPLALAPCTSDIHTVYEGGVGERHDMVLGHEACGEIVEVGELVKDFKVGDRILVAAITPDWNSVEAQAGYSMHGGGMLAGWKFSNVKDGVFGEYLRYNNSHKASLYLASGFPLVVWKQSALSHFVLEKGCGIAVESLHDLSQAIEQLDDKDYQDLLVNAKRIGQMIRNGGYLTNALNKIVK